MGSPLSPVVSSHFMEAFEHKALDIAPLKPSIFLQCVDDTFVIWQHRWDKLNEFLVFQNEVHSKICFTMEVEGLGSFLSWMFWFTIKQMVLWGAMLIGSPLTLIYIYLFKGVIIIIQLQKGTFHSP